MKKLITIKQARKILGFKQEFMAKKLASSQSNYSKMENGQRSFHDNHFEILSAILDIKLEYIVKNRIPIFIHFGEMENDAREDLRQDFELMDNN